MPAVATIALSDALGTPVVHNFIPLGSDQNGVWWFEDQSNADAIGYNRISLSLRRVQNAVAGQASDKTRNNRFTAKLWVPKTETLGTNDVGVTPPATLAYQEVISIEFVMPERASLQVRKDARKYAQFLLADTQVVAMTETLQMLY